MSLANSSAQEAVSRRKRDDAGRAGRAVVDLIRRGIRPSDILTREAFENAIVVSIALSGSTNAVLHLLAIAHAAGVPLVLDDFTRIGSRVPVLADLRPSGLYSMSDLIRIGGIQPLMRTLLEAGLLHGDCLTVTGRTLGPNLRRVKPYPAGQRIIRPLADPIKPDSSPGRDVRKSRAGRRGCKDHRQGRSAVLRARTGVRRRGGNAAGDPRWRRGGRRRDRRALRGAARRAGNARDAEPDRGDHGPGSRATRSRSSPTGVSRAAATASSSVTSRPRPTRAGTLALVRDGDRITIDAVRREINLDGRRRRARCAQAQLARARAVCDARRARQVRATRQQRLAGRSDRSLTRHRRDTLTRTLIYKEARALRRGCRY